MTAPGSGLGATLAFGAETTWATPVTPDHAIEFDSETAKGMKGTLQGKGLRGVFDLDRAARRRISTIGATGGFTSDIPNNGGLLLWKNALGTVVSGPTQIGTTGVYKTVFQLGSNRGLGLTVQKGLPQTNSTVQPFTLPGWKINKFGLSCNVGQLLKWAIDGVFYRELTATALAAPSYIVPNGIWSFLDGSICTIGGTATTTGGVVSITGGTTPTTLINGFTLDFTRTMAEDRRGFGYNGLIGEPIETDVPVASGTFAGEFTQFSEFYAPFVGDTSLPFHLAFTGPNIIGSSGTNVPTIDIVIPAMKIDTADTNASGPGLITQPLTWTALNDGVNPSLQVTVTSTDPAL